MDDNIQLAFIEGIEIGCRDVGHPCMWFGVKFLGGGSLQVLSWDEAHRLIEESEVYNFSQLDGKPCVVKVEGGTVTFLRLYK